MTQTQFFIENSIKLLLYIGTVLEYIFPIPALPFSKMTVDWELTFIFVLAIIIIVECILLIGIVSDVLFCGIVFWLLGGGFGLGGRQLVVEKLFCQALDKAFVL
jgi:hypothetical protein